ncbi:hypothetical protein FCL47_02870 [Desulfopila sp. IMCC35006]|nr:hypothetical protein FCL47_02870 [Desulfopila sp. IMCC35006]
MTSAIVMLSILLSLGGCFFPGPWHDRDRGHDRGRGHDHDRGGYDHHSDRGNDHDRDGDRYERR